MVPIGLLVTGEQAEIMEIREYKGHHPMDFGSDRCRDGQCRIEDMGIRVGKNVQILKNEGGGPLLIKVDESRIAMSRGMAMKIFVRRKV